WPDRAIPRSRARGRSRGCESAARCGRGRAVRVPISIWTKKLPCNGTPSHSFPDGLLPRGWAHLQPLCDIFPKKEAKIETIWELRKYQTELGGTFDSDGVAFPPRNGVL